MVRMTEVQSQVKSYQKMFLNAPLLNTQHYSVQVKGKWNNLKK